jgi:hypothetical protein
MPGEDSFVTWSEFTQFVATNLVGSPNFPYASEWIYAIGAGWDDVEFEKYYIDYILSTQIRISPKDNATLLKARPLEKLCHYFLKQGGIVTDIREITEPQKWQVDGQGPLNKTAIRMCFGDEICQQVGFQLYMEAKNHSSPATNEEFSQHFRRMDEHTCYLGVFVSTSGYRMQRGMGIAESIYINSIKKKFHLLLTFQSLAKVALNRMASLAVLQEVLCYAVNNSYVNDRDVQRNYCQEACSQAAKIEHARITSACAAPC